MESALRDDIGDVLGYIVMHRERWFFEQALVMAHEMEARSGKSMS